MFLAFLPVPILLAEALFAVTGSGLSVMDGNGIGQITPILIVLVMIALFARLVAKDEPFRFLDHYRRNWRRSLRGFLVFAGITVALSTSAYGFFWLTGKVTVSREAVDAFNYQILEDTLVTLLIVTVVAFTEEIIFRTFLMRYLRWNTSAAVTIGAVLFSSLIFTLSHRVDDPLIWLQGDQWQLFVGLFLLAVLLCVAYLSTGSFMCGVGIHAGLLYTEAFRYRTQLIDLQNDAWWLPPSYDVRLAPVLWILFVCVGVAIFLFRHRLNAAFAIEKPVVDRGLTKREPAGEPSPA